MAQLPTAPISTNLSEIKWHPPPEGKLKLNIDCSKEESIGFLTAGGLFRDAHGVWCGGYVKDVGCAPILDGELWSLFHGFKLCVDLGAAEILVEMDSLEVVALIKNRPPSSHHLFGLITTIRETADDFVTFQIFLVVREKNKVVDYI